MLKAELEDQEKSLKAAVAMQESTMLAVFRIHIHRIRIQPKISVRILAISLHYLKKKLNYFIIISFYHQKKSTKRKNVVKVTKKYNYVMII